MGNTKIRPIKKLTWQKTIKYGNSRVVIWYPIMYYRYPLLSDVSICKSQEQIDLAHSASLSIWNQYLSSSNLFSGTDYIHTERNICIHAHLRQFWLISVIFFRTSSSVWRAQQVVKIIVTISLCWVLCLSLEIPSDFTQASAPTPLWVTDRASKVSGLHFTHVW